jgi:hypothetical protein
MSGEACPSSHKRQRRGHAEIHAVGVVVVGLHEADDDARRGEAGSRMTTSEVAMAQDRWRCRQLPDWTRTDDRRSTRSQIELMRHD